jgi:hypothetical protein
LVLVSWVFCDTKLLGLDLGKLAAKHGLELAYCVNLPAVEEFGTPSSPLVNSSRAMDWAKAIRARIPRTGILEFARLSS